MIIDADFVAAGEGFTVGQIAVIAQAVAFQLLAQFGGQQGLCRAHIVRHEGLAFARCRLLAQERQHLGAAADIRHLVVVVQPSGQRRADFVNIGLQPVARVGAALVVHLRFDHVAGEHAHGGQIGQASVNHVHQADGVKRLPHPPRQCTITIGVVVQRRIVGEVDRVAIGVNTGGARPPARFRRPRRGDGVRSGDGRSRDVGIHDASDLPLTTDWRRFGDANAARSGGAMHRYAGPACSVAGPYMVWQSGG